MAFVLTPLRDSFFCRLCCGEFTFGIDLYEEDTGCGNEYLQDVINKYLPLRVDNDGKLPCRMCSDCHSQLVATVEFFNKIICGQNELRHMWQKESLLRKSLSSSDFLHLDETVDDDPIKVVNKEDNYFYKCNNELPFNMRGKSSSSGKPRGRPRKDAKNDVMKSDEVVQEKTDAVVEIIDEDDGETNTFRKRRRQPPKRFLESVAGQALDKLLDDRAECLPGTDDATVIGHLKTKDGARTKPIIKYDVRSGIKRRTKDTEGRNNSSRLITSEDVQVTIQDIHDTGAESSLECRSREVNDMTEEEKNSQGLELQLHSSGEEKYSKRSSNLVCTKCSRKFNHAPSLAYHMQVAHDQDEIFECASCDKTFRHKQLLLRHQTVHSEERPFHCTECSMQFKTNSNLWNHITNIHRQNQSKFQCDVCMQSFKYKSSLANHMLAHQGIKSFQCEYCDKKFSSKGNMMEHIRTHTGEKPFECSVCQKRFTTSSQVSLHVKTHSDVRPWQCSFCPRAFIIKEAWKTHERRHKGEKPYICHYCTRAFAENWALKKHIRLHTGEKPYKCSVCEKTFADCSNLKKHKNVHMEGTTGRTQLLQILKQGSRSIRNQSKDGKSSDEMPEFSGDNLNKTLFDQEGTPLSLSLPNGRTVTLESIDDDGILHALTSDGWTIQLQMPAGCDVEDENMLGLIREAILEAKQGKEAGENTTLLLDEEALLDPSLSDISNTIFLATDGDPDTGVSGLKNVYFIE